MANTTSSITPDSQAPELMDPVAVVCHDAGAANIILEEVRFRPSARWLPVFDGPAKRLWEAAGRPGGRLYGMEEALRAARSVLSGTGWASNLEHEARRGARLAGLHSVAVVDHWVNYAARFQRDGLEVLPDEIWVTDEYALRIASDTFPGLPVQLRTNHYLRAQADAVAAHGPPVPGRVLFLSEPIRFSWPGLVKPGELDALDYLVRNLDVLRLSAPADLRLRPHPSDAPGKYDAWLADCSEVNAALDVDRPLAHAIAEAEWVAGCETAALVIAMAAGRKALSTLPPAAPRCRLPHAELMHLRDMQGRRHAEDGRSEPFRE